MMTVMPDENYSASGKSIEEIVIAEPNVNMYLRHPLSEGVAVLIPGHHLPVLGPPAEVLTSPTDH